MNAILTRHLTRQYNTTLAVNDLELQVPSGSLYGLIGPNGAGKTTTLRMLAGLLEPTSGEIRINELSIRQYWREIQWQIGYMPDFFGVYDDLLVWEYLDFYARCYRLAPERRRRVVPELLELVGLAEKRDAYVHTLSRGMLQRLCLAHALVHEPQVLLLDEPASGLDPRARVEMRELLRELSRMGKTILLSSHILTELAELCDAVAIMERGRLVASGPVETLRRSASRGAARRTLRLHTLAPVNQVEPLLREFSTITDIFAEEASEDGARFEIKFNGDDSAAADLVDSLVANGLRVVSLSEKISSLEEAFLNITQGDVA